MILSAERLAAVVIDTVIAYSVRFWFSALDDVYVYFLTLFNLFHSYICTVTVC